MSGLTESQEKELAYSRGYADAANLSAGRIEALEAENERLRGVINDARLQLEYLNEKQERGSTNGVLARTRAALAPPTP